MLNRFTRAAGVLAVGAALSVAAVQGAGASTAVAKPNATPACGGNCLNLYSQQLGSGDIQAVYVPGSNGQAVKAKVGDKIDLKLGNDGFTNEDFTPSVITSAVTACSDGLLSPTSYACLNFTSSITLHAPADTGTIATTGATSIVLPDSAAVDSTVVITDTSKDVVIPATDYTVSGQNINLDPALFPLTDYKAGDNYSVAYEYTIANPAKVYEMNWSPNGDESGLCAGVAVAHEANELVTLQDCGTTTGNTLWVADVADAHLGYTPWVLGSDTNTTQPLVLQVNTGSKAPQNQLVVNRLLLLTGGFVPNQDEFAVFAGAAL